MPDTHHAPLPPGGPIDRDPEDERAAPPRDQAGHADRDGRETSGDRGAPDIVGPTGEEMPVQSHDDVDVGRRRHARPGTSPMNS